MGTFSIWHWVIVLAVVLLLFGGGGKIPRVMGDLAKGIRSFKSGLKEEDEKQPEPKTIDGTAEPVAAEKPAEQAAPKRENETVS
ncbi:MAG: twin-arginine translocase TatA/TatE family subunit [Alphaproteobacteria bacterium]|nr:twin-arginine translocase TatA/TatE family subunit [Alphaproteobacteria bacterium SS10]